MSDEPWSIHSKTAGPVGTVLPLSLRSTQEEKTNLEHINCKQVAALHLNIEQMSQKSCLSSKKTVDIYLFEEFVTIFQKTKVTVCVVQRDGAIDLQYCCGSCFSCT